MSDFFKQMVQEDLTSVFLNLEEFAEPYVIDGVTLPAVLDDYVIDNADRGTLPDRIGFSDGIYRNARRLLVKADDLGYLPTAREIMRVNNKLYMVSSVKEDMGLLTIVLEVNDT